MNGRECNPNRCKNCNIINNNDRCKNLQLQLNFESKLIVGMSEIAGWGLFANEDIKKDCLIGEYKGELINDDIVNKRDRFKDYERSTYMFKLDDEYTVDSRRMGNMLRYANHSKINSNSYTKIVFSGGHRKIGLFAKRTIKIGEEILFDYDGQGILGKQFTWINNEKKMINHNISNNEKIIRNVSNINNDNNIINIINKEKNNNQIKTNDMINDSVHLINNKIKNNKNHFMKRKIKIKKINKKTINNNIKTDINNYNSYNDKNIYLKDSFLNNKLNLSDNTNNLINYNEEENNKLSKEKIIQEKDKEKEKQKEKQKEKEKENIIIKEPIKEKQSNNIIDILSNKNNLNSNIKIKTKNLFKTEEDEI